MKGRKKMKKTELLGLLLSPEEAVTYVLQDISDKAERKRQKLNEQLNGSFKTSINHVKYMVNAKQILEELKSKGFNFSSLSSDFEKQELKRFVRQLVKDGLFNAVKVEEKKE